MTEPFYAHSKDGEPPERWQPLEESPKRVTKMVRFFAEQVGGGEVGDTWQVCGLIWVNALFHQLRERQGVFEN